MKFTVCKASDWKFNETVEINTLEDLRKLSDQHGADLIVRFDDGEITVYDDYVE